MTRVAPKEVQAACCVVVPGTTMPAICELRIATTTILRTATITLASVVPELKKGRVRLLPEQGVILSIHQVFLYPVVAKSSGERCVSRWGAALPKAHRESLGIEV